MKVKLVELNETTWGSGAEGAWARIVDAEDIKVPAKGSFCAAAKDLHAAGLIGEEAGVCKHSSVAAGKARRELTSFASGKPGAFKAAAKKMAEALRDAGVESASWALPGSAGADEVEYAVLALREAMYSYVLTKPTAKPPKLAKLSLAVAGAKSLQARFEAAQAIADGIDLAKELGNRPANRARPVDLALAAQAIAAGDASKRIAAKIHGRKGIEKLGMGSFLAVAQGSANEPQLIELSYKGAGAARPIVLVGKGITFDSGGISLKPGAEMDEMKFDMCGAASVLGVFEALSKSKLKINVVGLIPACENMPSGQAVKPGDVVESMSGQTIEILNTDAEGRLVLCDALTYAKKFDPVQVVDIATLTGACVIALGAVRSGMYSNDEALAKELCEAGEASGDKCWRMPLDEEYAEGLKSNFADMGNIAGRGAGSVTAAKFLQKFVDYPWGHLDIAGTAWRGGAAKGSTGRPVPLLMAWLAAKAK